MIEDGDAIVSRFSREIADAAVVAPASTGDVAARTMMVQTAGNGRM